MCTIYIPYSSESQIKLLFSLGVDCLILTQLLVQESPIHSLFKTDLQEDLPVTSENLQRKVTEFSLLCSSLSLAFQRVFAKSVLFTLTFQKIASIFQDKKEVLSIVLLRRHATKLDLPCCLGGVSQ